MITYKDLLKFKPGRVAMTLLIAAASLPELLADNKITVEDFTIVNGKTAVVSVKLENDPDVIAMGAKITLPAGMTIVPQYDEYVDEDVNFILNSSRTYDPTQLYDEQVVQRHFINDNHKGNAYTVGVGHDDFMPFIGNSGEELFQFTVKASDGLIDESKIQFTGIHFDKKDGTTLTEVEQDDFDVNVTKVASLPPVGILTTDADEYSITPGEAHRQIITVSLENDEDVTGLQAKIVLPQGLKFVTGVEGFLAGISMNPRAKKLKPVLNRETGVITLFQDKKTDRILAGSGEIFAFLVEADTSLPAESEIDINNIRITTTYNDEVYTIKADDVNVVVLNPDAAAKPAADEAIDKAETAITDALAKAEEALKEVTDKYEDYMDSDKMQDAKQAAEDAVQALKDKIEDAWENGNLAETDYSDEVAACEETVAALEHQGKEELAKAEADNAVADAQKALDEAIAAVAEQYPDVKDTKAVQDAIKDAQNAIKALEDKAAEAYDKGNLQDATTSEWEGMADAAIDEILPAAKQAQAEKDEFDEEAKNTQTLSDAKKTATDASNGVPAEVKNDVAAEQQALDDAVKALEDAVNAAAANKNANTDEVKADIADKAQAVADAAEALTEAAADAMEAYEAELAAEQANEKLLSDAMKAAKDAENAVPTAVKDMVAEEQQALTDAVKALEDAVIDAAQNKTANTDASKDDIAAKDQAVKDAAKALTDAAEVAAVALEALEQLAEEQAKADALGIPENVKDFDDPEVKEAVDKAEDAIQKAEDAVDALEKIIGDAINDGTITTPEVQQAIAEAVAGADEAIAAAEEAIAAAQEKYDEAAQQQAINDEAYGDLMKDMKDLQDALNDAKETIEGLEDVELDDFQDPIKEIEDAIDDLQGKLDDAYANKELTGDTRIDDIDNGKKDEITEDIADVVEAAKELQAQYDALKPIRDAKLAEIDELQKALDDAVKAIEDLPSVDVADYQDAIDGIQKDIDDAKAGVQSAFKKLELTEDYDVDPEDAIANDIAKLLEDAQAEQAAEDAALADANNLIKNLNDDLQKALDDAAKAGVTEEEIQPEKQAAEEAVDALEQFVKDNEGDLTKDENAAQLDKLGTDAEQAVDALQDKVAEVIASKIIPGDVTGDGKVEDADVDEFIEMYLADELPESGTEDFIRYDANKDGVITLADAVAIFNLSNGLNFDGTDPNAARAEQQWLDGSLSVEATDLGNGVIRYALNLKGNFEYAGFSVDVKGAKVINEVAEGMNLRSADKNGTHRIAAYNFGQAAAAGTVLTVDVMGEAEFDNINFSTANAQNISLKLGQTTAIAGVNAAAQDGTIYDLGGRVMKSMKKGVNIIRNAFGSVKKVNVK